jgi:hypothetical protein
MTEQVISQLRRRMIEDMTIRKFAQKTQHDYERRVKELASYLKLSPDTAKPEDVRGFQLHPTSSGAGTLGECREDGAGKQLAPASDHGLGSQLLHGGEVKQCISLSGIKQSSSASCFHVSCFPFLRHRVFGSRPQLELPAITPRSITIGGAVISLLLGGCRGRRRPPRGSSLSPYSRSTF